MRRLNASLLVLCLTLFSFLPLARAGGARPSEKRPILELYRGRAFVMPSSITVAGITIQNWRYSGTTAKIRIYANASFYTSTGGAIVGGAQTRSSKQWYTEVNCTVSGTSLICPSFTIDSTMDSTTNPNATYTAVFVDAGNQEREVFLDSFRVPITMGTSLTWEKLAIYKAGNVAVTDGNTTYTKAQVNRLLGLDESGGFPSASSAIRGMTYLSTDPVASNSPIAVGNNDAGIVAARAATSANLANQIVKRDASGNFSAGTITASLNGNAATATSATSASTANFATTAGSVVNATNAQNFVGTGSTSNAVDLDTAEVAGVLPIGRVPASSALVPDTLIKRDSSNNFSAGTITANLNGNATSANTATSADVAAGLVMPGASTTNAVDLGTSEVAGILPNSKTTATSTNLGNTIVTRDASGNFSAANITATNFLGNATSATTANNATTATTATNAGNLIGTGSTTGAVDLATAEVAGILPNSKTTATAGNAPNSIVARNSTGGFDAGTITATLDGNAASATNAQNLVGTGSTSNAVDLDTAEVAGRLSLSNLAGNTANNRKFLSSTGNGSANVSNDWILLASSDIPAINLGASGAGGVTGITQPANGGLGFSTLPTDGKIILGVSGGTYTLGTIETTAPGLNINTSGIDAHIQFTINGPAIENLNADNIASGTVTEANGGTGKSSYSKGDVLAGNNSSGLTRLTLGSNGQVLTVDTSEPTGMKWADPNATDSDEKAGVSTDDTTPGYLEDKITAGAGITITKQNAGDNETLEISNDVSSIVTSKGDTLAATSGGALVRVPVGSNGQVLTADSTVAAGVSWQAPAGGGGGSTDVEGRLGSPLTFDMNSASAQTIYTVPTGKRLVITKVAIHSFSLNPNDGDTTSISIAINGTNTLTTIGGVGTATSAKYIVQSFTGSYFTLATEGQTITAKVNTVAGFTLTAQVVLYGYLID